MNYPTGMNVGTGNHYYNVAGQMHAYLNSPTQRNGSPFQGQFVAGGGRMASQALQFGAQRMGVNPMIVNGVGGFARNLMRNILS